MKADFYCLYNFYLPGFFRSVFLFPLSLTTSLRSRVISTFYRSSAPAHRETESRIWGLGDSAPDPGSPGLEACGSLFLSLGSSPGKDTDDAISVCGGSGVLVV